ncbi:MAG: polymer-forming cytoskeletal protein [Deltaproteobacteria bacterium]|nr:polymer-forming cytoskeletal protein [Deltaproteobacteria bacterium]MBW2391291.1 polymer-forming cytoskeletal protein [Deltaproteobacteria bacterium]
MSPRAPTEQSPSADSGSAGETERRAAPVIVQAGASFEGVVSCRHASRIDGYFRGDVVGDDRIELGEQSDVSGRIEAREIIVAGLFEGELVARQCIELLSTARVTGEFRALELLAEEGCMVTGRCRTGPGSHTDD